MNVRVEASTRRPSFAGVLLTLVVASLVVKLPVLAFEHREQDERIYWELSTNLVRHGRYSLQGTDVVKSLSPYMYDRPLFHHPPLFAVALLPFVLMEAPSAAVLVSWLGQALAMVGVALFGLGLLRARSPAVNAFPPVFWLPVLGVAVDPFLTFISRRIWMDNLLAGLVTMAFGLAVLASRRGAGRTPAMASGVALGLALLTKVSAVLAIPGLVVAAWILPLAGGARRRILFWIALPALLLAAPWYVCFYAQYGRLVAPWVSPDAWLIEHSPMVRAAVEQPWYFYVRKLVLIQPLIVVLCVGVIRKWSRQMAVPLTWFLVFLAGLTVLGVSGFGLQTRHLAPAYPALYAALYALSPGDPTGLQGRIGFLAVLALLCTAITAGIFLAEPHLDEVVGPLELLLAPRG
jgi:4-amino-4-deoxy-L-arabinose transferase-like glycosyltransferase